MLRIKIVSIKMEIPQGMISPIQLAAKELYNLGYEIVTENEDVLFLQIYSHMNYDETEKLIINYKKPIILLDSSASSGYNWFEFLAYDHVIGYIKKQVYKDFDMYKYWYPRMRYHYYLTYYSNKLRSLEKNPFVTNDILNKVKLGWNLGLTRRKGIDYSKTYYYYPNKSIDFHIAMTINNTVGIEANRIKGNLDKFKSSDIDFGYVEHRKKCLENFDKFQKNNHSEISKIWYGHNADEYWKTLKLSKFCISPWGKGENCFRTFEAYCMSTIPIIPETDHMITWPNIYQKYSTYIPCKIDFSDLADICYNINKNYNKFIHIPEYGYNIMKDSWKNSVFANRFDSIMKEFKL